MTKQSSRIPYLDSLRGFAALWVVLFHCVEGRHLPALVAALPGWLSNAVFFSGHLGVPVFFVLSGFVLARISADKLDSARAVGRFLLQRLVRLSPPYYLAVLLGAAMLLAKAHSEGGVPPLPSQVMAHLIYGQTILGYPALNAVFWTLAIEVQFYIAFALLLWLAHVVNRGVRNGAVAMVLVGLVAVATLLWPAKIVETPIWRGGFIPLWYSFLCGSLVALSTRQARALQVGALAYVASVAAVGVAQGDGFALTAAATALFIFVAERQPGLARVAGWAPLSFLGLVSYSLYLFHNPVTGSTARLVRRFLPGGLASDVVLLACVVAASIAAAALMYVLIEKPATRWSHLVLKPGGRRDTLGTGHA